MHLSFAIDFLNTSAPQFGLKSGICLLSWAEPPPPFPKQLLFFPCMQVISTALHMAVVFNYACADSGSKAPLSKCC